MSDWGSVMAYTTRWGDGVRLLLAALLLAVLSGCGWRLAGSGLDQKPLGDVYLQGVQPVVSTLTQSYAGVSDATKRARGTGGAGTSGILANTLGFTKGTSVRDKPDDAELHIEMLADVTQRRILALSGAGRVRELELVLNVRFAVRDKGVYIIPANDIQFRQTVSYDDSLVLSKEAEISALIESMQQDAATQILRRIYAIRK
jgi:LPS-assembly lipoprotein